MSECITGSCLCGSVKFEIDGPFDRFYFCYCSRCRKNTGSAHASNLFAKSHQLRWLEGEALVRRFDLAEAKNFSRCFCSRCGSAVPHLVKNSEVLVIPAGCLNESPSLKPLARIFWPDHADWYEQGITAPTYDSYPKG